MSIVTNKMIIYVFLMTKKVEEQPYKNRASAE